MTPWRIGVEVPATFPYRAVEDLENSQAFPPKWIEWPGGDCPVPTETRVKVQFRGQTREEAEASEPVRAGSMRSCVIPDWWKHEGPDDCDIIAYAII